MTHLLDVNVLIALAWPSHIHHHQAHRWFQLEGKCSWATCPLTQSGFVRVSSNQRVIPDALPPREALALLERIVAVPGHVFWADDVSLVSAPEVARERIHGHRQVADAHLLALALRHGGAVATFDGGFLDLVSTGVDPRRAVRMID